MIAGTIGVKLPRANCFRIDWLTKAAQKNGYASARGVLSGVAESPDAEEFNFVRTHAEDARMYFESTWLEWEQHRVSMICKLLLAPGSARSTSIQRIFRIVGQLGSERRV